MIDYEYRTFTCRKYRINTTITYGYDISGEDKVLVSKNCSLMDDGTKKHNCKGMQEPDFKCPYVMMIE